MVTHNELIFVATLESTPYTTVAVIAEYTGYTERTLNNIINKHKKDLREVGGVLHSESAKPTTEQGGRPRKIYHLNEQQAKLFITLLANTAPVIEFKKKLVKAFFQVRSELHKRQDARSNVRNKNKDLSAVISDLGMSSHQYTNLNILAWNHALGTTPSAVKRAKNVKDAYQTLSADEAHKLALSKNVISGLLMIGKDYHQVKATLGVA